jgi:hypothetical protein
MHSKGRQFPGVTVEMHMHSGLTGAGQIKTEWTIKFPVLFLSLIHRIQKRFELF